MLKKDGKELVLSKSFMMTSGEQVSIVAAELQGAELLIQAREFTGQEDQRSIEAQPTANLRGVMFSIPARKDLGYSSLPILKMGNVPEGPLSGYILVQFFQEVMTVQIDIYLERNLKYSPN
jgi:hypothetical protein